MAELIKVYTYTRVSTTMQIDGFSLDAQDEAVKRYAMANDYKIVGQYSDEGKSGTNTEGRPEFQQMMNDIESEKDGVKYVIVYPYHGMLFNNIKEQASDICNNLDRSRELCGVK